MAVADVFTALTEDRPYRKGLPVSEALEIMRDMARRNALDRDMVGLLADDVERINQARLHGQRKAVENFEQLRVLCHKPGKAEPIWAAPAHGRDEDRTCDRNAL